MYQTAQIYVEKLGLDIECKYISCSRYSLRIPLYHLNMEDAMEYICRDSIDATLARILNRAALGPEEQAEVARAIGEEGRENDPVPFARLEKIQRKLSACNVFIESVVRHSKEEMPKLEGYLRQEGFLDGMEDAIVDSGWVGSMQKTLNQILRSMGRTRALEGYYWGLYELPAGVERKYYHCYYFSPEGQLREKVNFNNNLFEAVFSAPHGMTLGYEKKKEKFLPVYDALPLEHRQYMEELENILMAYTKEAAGHVQSLEAFDCSRARKILTKLLRLFMAHPSKEEAATFGKLGFCDDVLEYGDRQLAAVMSEKELRDNHVINKTLVMLGLRKDHIRESAWYEGSVIRCSQGKGRYHLMQYAMYKYLLYIRQMYMWRRKNVQKKDG